ncbi:MAG: tyrosine-type recombinase/integrase [Candidatus Krumholzibacteriia bacterium]
MLEDVIRNVRVRGKIEGSGFLPILQEFEAYLRLRGYASTTVSFYEQGAVHFALWIVRKKLGPSEITDDLIAAFLSRHLLRCRCPLPGVRQRQTVRAALRHFEIVLDAGCYRPQKREAAPAQTDHEVQRFDRHLVTTCGMREETRTYRRRYVREFLHYAFGDGPVEPARLAPQDVMRFVSRRASGLKAGSTHVLASSLRSYFRFLLLQGEADEALLMAVPSAASWKRAPLPKSLNDDEVRSLFGAFNRKTATGRRDYAITRCLADLGLRAGEVARLRLDDIDWRKGTLRIVGGKSRRDDELPIPAAVGSAIAGYLRRERPETAGREVFLRLRPPVGQAITRQIVCNVVLRAASRAGLAKVITGPRILRHTAATRMVRGGASIKEVADVLRHRCLDTTAIYTKVDLSRLATVALPWPEDHS